MTAARTLTQIGIAPRLLTRHQAAAFIGVSEPTFMVVCPIRPIALGPGKRLERYDIRALDAWIELIGSPQWTQNMTIVRVKGVKRYRVRDRWFTYHRKTGTRIKSEFGTGAFFAELAAIEGKVKRDQVLPGTLGLLLGSYRASPGYADLAPTTKAGYGRMMNILRPAHDMPLVELTPQFIAKMRDKLAATRGRRLANYVMAGVSVACEHGKEHGILSENPVAGVKRVRRARNAAPPNRSWTREERQTVLEHIAPQLRVPVALAMFTGLRKADVLTLPKSAIRSGQITRRTGKAGYQLSLPIHPDLARLLSVASPHSAMTIAATAAGTPWTVSGFNSRVSSKRFAG